LAVGGGAAASGEATPTSADTSAQRRRCRA
jgi:hypothetical protein